MKIQQKIEVVKISEMRAYFHQQEYHLLVPGAQT
jgi:hypothetical protein